jgi:VIT1/CCC1 family predicted Fe2+/Mn2+ transporter
MNGLIWIGQVALAAVFLVAGGTKLFAYEKLVKKLEDLPRRKTIGMSRSQAVLVGALEIAGAIGVILPAALTPEALVPDYLLVRLAASGLALLMVAATIYHLSRKEPGAPSIAAFLLALFVIVGRWPH